MMRASLPAVLLLALPGCSKDEPPRIVAPPVASTMIQEKPSAPASSLTIAEETSAPTEPNPHPEPPPRVWGTADTDPENNGLVAPPDPVPDCHERLIAAGVEFNPATLPLKQLVKDIPTCGAHDAVTVTQGPLGIAVRPAALMTCQMALGFVGLERVVQEFAEKELGEDVRSLHQGGTYSCRKMARFDLVSEHSYGNAIDVFAFTLASGRKISVQSHYGQLDASVELLPKEARFLRGLASAAFDRDHFSVALTPYWDALHRDHFHFDMARYRVDGTRPR